ncbi:MAG: hypothetical protein ACYC27_11105 [Armatimonadota bacterium]
MFSCWRSLAVIFAGFCLISVLPGETAAKPVMPVKQIEPIIIRPKQAPEKDYLYEDRGACNEMGTDPRSPFTRIGDMKDLYYIYKFSPGKGNMAYLLINVASQFLISASTDGGKTYTHVAEMRKHELVGTRVFIDLTPFMKNSDSVLLKFEDRYKEDGWGALTTEIRYYQAGKGSATRIFVNDKWQANGKPYKSGKSIQSSKPVTFTTAFNAPSEWKQQDLAVYLSSIKGTPVSAKLNGVNLKLSRTWDQGYWSSISQTVKPGKSNSLTLTVKPDGGKAGLWTPARAGFRYAACAVPVVKSLDKQTWKPNRQYEPYSINDMNFLAGNFMQCLYDDRYNLLTFMPSEHITVHYLHDSFRSLTALAEEERHTPVVRLELIRKLYKGCKGGLMPGDEYLFSFKHDERPIDIRTYNDTADLAVVQKMDMWAYACTMGISVPDKKTIEFADTPVNQSGDIFTFTRDYILDGRSIPVHAKYALGGVGIPPTFEFDLDGNGPVSIDLKRLTESGMWFTPGSWGPEAVVLPDGKEMWAYKEKIAFDKPDFNYLMIRGGNGNTPLKQGDYTYCRALMVMWDSAPDKISSLTKADGRYGTLINDMTLEYANTTPSRVKITIMPFSGFPASLKAPRLIAENIAKTGKTGMAPYDAVWTSNCNGIGPDGLAAAAYILKKYNCPEAKEAEDLAVKAMKACTELDKAGTQTNELYYLISGCMYMHLLGHTEYDEWARTWADRMIAMQTEDGSWPWLNFQLRCMEGLLRAYELLGDDKYLQAVQKGVKTLSYKDNELYWNGKIDYYDDFGGATTYGIFGFLGMKDMAQNALDARPRYIDDRGMAACSDLNPYMLGLSARGLGFKTEPKQILGLTDFVEYGGSTVRRLNLPTAYLVNPHHPLAKIADFKLEE